MAVNFFANPPKSRFLRLLPVALGVYLLGTLSLGAFVAGGSGVAFQKSLLVRLARIPEACLSGNHSSDFQRRQCEDYWTYLQRDLAIAFSPFALALFAWWAANDQLQMVYRRARKRIEKGQALFKGTVTDPPSLPRDGFAWFHCLGAFSLQLASGAQMRVYVPENSPPPRPGETLAVFDCGKVFGAKRYVAVLYAPHVAVVRGGRGD